ncbi:MAG TPA: GIY-YIG nuclease family protein [Verrucomicrobiae bacterium]|nr:GIY-YIG nuclease family protein [Verrucomicrobiae bacterium]
MSQSGYIYFASNSSMPGLLKIGHSLESPFERLAKLRSTGVPTPFFVLACFHVNDCLQTEKRVHELLSNTRFKSDREFFQISIDKALAECLPCLKELLTSSVTADSQSKSVRFAEEEEKVLLSIVRQTNPTVQTIKRAFDLSDVKLELLLGSLAKRKMIRRVTEERSRGQYYAGRNPGYTVKAVRAEHRGIQYLLDHQQIRDDEL